LYNSERHQESSQLDENADKLLDDVGWRILHELQENARLSLAELGRRVGLSTPAALERVRRMEEQRIILGYHADVDRAKVGIPITAFIRISVQGEALKKAIAAAESLDEVLECHRVTGTDSFVMKVGVSSIEHLQALFDYFSPYVATTTSIVLSSPVSRRTIMGNTNGARPAGKKPSRRRIAEKH
jgi:Lrp/AsnC family leucine-responsive transcriptional regulator